MAEIGLDGSEIIHVLPKAEMVPGGLVEQLTTMEMAQARSVTATAFPLTGEITSPHNVRPIGIATGIGGVTIGGMVIIAVSSTAPGLSSISDSIPGGHTGIPTTTITTPIRTAMIRGITIRAFTKAKSITVRAVTDRSIN